MNAWERTRLEDIILNLLKKNSTQWQMVKPPIEVRIQPDSSVPWEESENIERFENSPDTVWPQAQPLDRSTTVTYDHTRTKLLLTLKILFFGGETDLREEFVDFESVPGVGSTFNFLCIHSDI